MWLDLTFLRNSKICHSRELIFALFLAEKVFTFLSQDEVERMKQEEGNYFIVLLQLATET
jgi:hypothetical protein